MMPSLHHRAADHLRGVSVVDFNVVAGTVNADLFATRLRASHLYASFCYIASTHPSGGLVVVLP